ncbi:MAG: alpha/beta hydrolase [Silicimonas sp.]|nr:alpha/beta hydrolase [Silicimonas sp.]
MKAAPFRADLATSPKGAQVVWRHASDGVRLRLGAWRPEEDAIGTVLLYPGRTEYIEKYGKVIGELVAAGWAVATLDWRGQGHSDRLDDDARLGHVANFTDYQRDVAELTALVDELELPEPRMLLAHSMGGCIGLRSLCDGLAVDRAVFSAPMWGIQMPAYARPLTHVLPPVARMLKREKAFSPGTKPESYVTDTGFEENMLTSDRETYQWLATHAAAVPEFALGGPSVQWVGAATQEFARLFALPRPKLPVLTFVGTDEKIVLVDAIERFHRNWSEANLHYVDGARHEVMMEAPAIRTGFMRSMLEFFAAGASGGLA